MDSKPQLRFTLGKQSSMSPHTVSVSVSDSDDELETIDPRVRLMFFSSEGALEGIKKLLDSGTDVNFKDIDNRTALHVAACRGLTDFAELLLKGGAEMDPQDKRGSTRLNVSTRWSHDLLQLFCCHHNYIPCRHLLLLSLNRHSLKTHLHHHDAAYHHNHRATMQLSSSYIPLYGNRKSQHHFLLSYDLSLLKENDRRLEANFARSKRR